MSVCSVSIIPVGKGASISQFVADCLRVLEQFPDLKVQLTPMGTQIEGATPRLFEAVQAMHEAPFQAGSPRVYTVFTLDDRRDKETTLQGKIAAVHEKLGK